MKLLYEATTLAATERILLLGVLVSLVELFLQLSYLQILSLDDLDMTLVFFFPLPDKLTHLLLDLLPHFLNLGVLALLPSAVGR